MKKYISKLSIAAVVIVFVVAGLAQASVTESEKLNAFLDKAFMEQTKRNPVAAAQIGLKYKYGEWGDLSDSKAAADLAFEVDLLAKMKQNFNYAALDPQAKLSYQLFERQVADDTESFRYRFDNYIVNQMFGVHAEVPTFLINIHQISDVADAKAYISRTSKVAALMDQVIDNMKESEARGVIPPRFVFPLVLDTCAKIISGAPFDAGPDNPVFADFKKKVGALKSVSPKEQQKLVEDEKNALLSSFKPGYEKLIAALKTLQTKATDDAGIWKFPDGAAYYANRLRYYTTTTKTAAEIHELGLKEVARIQQEMGQIKDKVGFKGDLQAFFKYLREDPRFYLPDTPEGRAEYLKRSEQIIDAMRARLDELFIVKPKAPLVVKAVEPFREKSSAAAFYNQPSLDGSRPGMFYVNLGDLKSNPLYKLEALAYHEGIPGHHMQLAIGQELKGIPTFRKVGYYGAYIEGWGLYSELTPKEIGFYQDPYSDFGRLSMELWRAARLVVDTGIHDKRWTRQQAIDYLRANTPNSEAECIDAINRYIVVPGQATAYKMGELEILELRDEAKAALGSKFDIRKFHEVVLANGTVPLDVLRQQVKAWVDASR